MKYDNFVRLEMLTPVHIGCGDTSDPLDYVITHKDGRDYYCQIDLNAWLEDYPDQDELAKVLDSGKLQSIRKYIYDHLDPDVYARTRSLVLSPEITQKYRKHLNNLNSPNQLLIDPALKNPLSGGLIIPGSSIKGAMRTAVIDWCDQNWKLDLKNNSRTPRDYTQTLEKALGSIRNSTFKQLKIGDFEATSGNGAIISATERSRNPKKTAGTPKNSCEVTQSAAIQNDIPSVFGQFSIGEQSVRKDALLTCTMSGQTQRWTLPELMVLVSDFYQKRYVEERKKFYDQPHFMNSKKTIQLLDKELLNLTENQMILRLGHYSHVECMTITANKPQGRKGVFGTTRTLADGVHPFGWVKLTLCSKADHDQYLQQKQLKDNQLARQRRQQRQVKMELRQQELNQQLEEQRQKQQAEQERQVRKEDECENPWKKVAREINQIKNWGDLKQQIFEKEELTTFRHIAEFTQAVYDQALMIRNTASKWDEKRDEQLARWFEPTGQQWQNRQIESDPGKQLSEQEQKEIAQIEALNDWGIFKDSKMEFSFLSLAALEVLLSRFRQWGCDNKKAKKDKQNTWNEVRRLIQEKKK